jgi:peptidyl-prolyl cis-trans isomerase C
VGELEDRLADVAPFQLATFGGSDDLIRHSFLEKIVVPELLLSVVAEAQKVEREPATAYAIDRALSNATLRVVRAQVGPASAISTADIRKYYDENRGRYDTPERYQIWRILCSNQSVARDVLDQTMKDPTPKTFAALAREHSLDKATNLRSGNLGFVTADGASNEPGLVVDPAVVHAVQQVHDGELVSHPVAEGEYFSVVWRRGTVAARKLTMDDVAAQIRDSLWRNRVKKETDDLMQRLRATRLHDVEETLLDQLDLRVDGDGGAMALRKH